MTSRCDPVVLVSAKLFILKKLVPITKVVYSPLCRRSFRNVMFPLIRTVRFEDGMDSMSERRVAVCIGHAFPTDETFRASM